MTRLFTVVVLVACSSRAPAPTGPTGPDGARGSDEVKDTTAGSGSSVAVPPDPKVTEAQCSAMIDHLIDVDVRSRPADQQIGADEQAEVSAKVRTHHMEACLKLSPEMVGCVMAATTATAIEACDR